MEKIILCKQSFIAYIEHEEDQLLITTKSGKQYKFAVSQAEFNEIKQANNKGSFIALNILSGPKRKQGVFTRLVPQVEVKRNCRQFSHQFLAQ